MTKSVTFNTWTRRGVVVTLISDTEFELDGKRWFLKLRDSVEGCARYGVCDRAGDYGCTVVVFTDNAIPSSEASYCGVERDNEDPRIAAAEVIAATH